MAEPKRKIDRSILRHEGRLGFVVYIDQSLQLLGDLEHVLVEALRQKTDFRLTRKRRSMDMSIMATPDGIRKDGAAVLLVQPPPASSFYTPWRTDNKLEIVPPNLAALPMPSGPRPYRMLRQGRGEFSGPILAGPMLPMITGLGVPIARPDHVWANWLAGLISTLLNRAGTLSIASPTTGQLASIAEYRDELVRRVAKDSGQLATMHWKYVEEVVAELLERDGFQVVRRQHSWDGGIDLLAYEERQFGRVIYAFQVKRHGVPVGARVVRELYGALEIAKADVGIVVATSEFTADGLDHAKALRSIKTLDAQAIQQWAHRITTSTR